MKPPSPHAGRSNAAIAALTLYLLGAILHPNALAADASLYFREDWKEIPFALPITQEHVAHPQLVLETHGPGKFGIKKSHHAEIENDPYYVWSGRCEFPWALTLERRGALADLSMADALVRWRSRQSGDHALHLVLKLPGNRWIISEQSDAGQTWHEHEFRIADLTWRYFSIVKTVAEERVPTPELNRVEAIGFTDQRRGKGSPSSSRVDWIEVHGGTVSLPPRVPRGVRTTRASTELPDGVVECPNLVYARYGTRALTLDLYKPAAGAGPFPAVLFIHGGGWYKGDPSSYTAMAQRLAAQGYVTMNLFYRLSGEAPFPAAVYDCKSAVRWARAHAQTFRIDPERIGALGGSAGGHLSGLLATSGQSARLNQGGSFQDESSALQAAVVMAGNMDFTTEAMRELIATDPRRRLRTFLGGTWDEAQANFRDASPLTHVSAQTPPILFMDGELDRPGERYPEMQQKLDAHGVAWEFYQVPQAPHAFWPLDPFVDPVMEVVTAFFDRTLKRKR